jgi:hypothetical protein
MSSGPEFRAPPLEGEDLSLQSQLPTKAELSILPIHTGRITEDELRLIAEAGPDDIILKIPTFFEPLENEGEV